MRNTVLTIIIALLTVIKTSAQSRDTIATFRVDENEKITLRHDYKNRGIAIDLAGYEILFGEGKEPSLKQKKSRSRAKFSILSDNSIGFIAPSCTEYSGDIVENRDILDLDHGKSIFFSSNLIGISAPLDQQGVLTLKTALNLRCFNYTFDDDITIEYQDGKIAAVDIDGSHKKSKLTTAYLSVPLSLSIKVKNKFSIEPVVYGGLNINAHTKYKRPIVKGDDFKGVNPVIAGAMLRVMYKNFGLFTDYTFTKLYKKNSGVNAKTFSLGLTLSL